MGSPASKGQIELYEGDIEILYSAFLNRVPEFNLYTEYPCNEGYADVYIAGNGEHMDYNILIELKYIKKKEYSRKVLEEKLQEGIKQLEEYSKDTRLHNKELKKYLVVFVGNKVQVIEEI